MPEWLNGAVSKTVVGLVPTVGSNPTLSAKELTLDFRYKILDIGYWKVEIAQQILSDLNF